MTRKVMVFVRTPLSTERSTLSTDTLPDEESIGFVSYICILVFDNESAGF